MSWDETLVTLAVGIAVVVIGYLVTSWIRRAGRVKVSPAGYRAWSTVTHVEPNGEHVDWIVSPAKADQGGVRFQVRIYNPTESPIAVSRCYVVHGSQPDHTSIAAAAAERLLAGPVDDVNLDPRRVVTVDVGNWLGGDEVRRMEGQPVHAVVEFADGRTPTVAKLVDALRFNSATGPELPRSDA